MVEKRESYRLVILSDCITKFLISSWLRMISKMPYLDSLSVVSQTFPPQHVLHFVIYFIKKEG